MHPWTVWRKTTIIYTLPVEDYLLNRPLRKPIVGHERPFGSGKAFRWRSQDLVFTDILIELMPSHTTTIFEFRLYSRNLEVTEIVLELMPSHTATTLVPMAREAAALCFEHRGMVVCPKCAKTQGAMRRAHHRRARLRSLTSTAA